MSLKFCKACGTLYDDSSLDCPRCTARALAESGAAEQATDNDMPEEEIARQRKRHWMQLIIGVPALIGFFYLVFFLFKLLVR